MQVLGIALTALLAVNAFNVGGLPTGAQAESYTDELFSDLRMGQVTDKRSDAIYINQLAYEFDRQLTVKDDEERPRQLKDFEAGAEVKFRLKQGRLSLLVLILPK